MLFLLFTSATPVARRFYVSYAKASIPPNSADRSVVESITLTDAPNASIPGIATRFYVSYAKASIPEPSVVATRFYVSYAKASIPEPGAGQAVTEILSLIDAPTARAVYNASVAETLVLDDAQRADILAQLVVTWLQLYEEEGASVVVESLALSDVVGATVIRAASTVESISLADVSTASAIYRPAIAESISLVDAASASVLQVGGTQVVESLSLTDVTTALAIHNAAVTETISLADVANAKGVYARATTETLSLVDQPTASLPGELNVYDVSVVETITLSDHPSVPAEAVFGEPTARLWAGAINWRLGSQRAAGSARMGNRLAAQRSMRFGSRIAP